MGYQGLFSHDNGIIYRVNLHYQIKSECLVHDHSDLALQDLCHYQKGFIIVQ